MTKKFVIFIVGPTASGKSKLSLAVARRINGEIICCDSMQVYKEIKILSERPGKNETNKIAHHLYGIVSIAKKFDVNQYCKLARNKIDEIHQRQHTPIVVGGTGLYVNALLDGIFQIESTDAKIRNGLYEFAKKEGSLFLHNQLKKIDSTAAKKIHPNDLRRIVRALEVYKATGKKISELQKERSGIYGLYKIKIFAINVARSKLYDKINKRIDSMFGKGAVGEIKKIHRIGKTAKYALGIREIRDYLQGRDTLEEAKDKLKRNTRRYAKRQLTWFRRDSRIEWLKEGLRYCLPIVLKRVSSDYKKTK